MNARQRRKLRRKWSRILGEDLTFREACEARAGHGSTIRCVRRVIHFDQAPRWCPGCHGDGCSECGGSGVHYRWADVGAFFRDEFEDPVETAREWVSDWRDIHKPGEVF